MANPMSFEQLYISYVIVWQALKRLCQQDEADAAVCNALLKKLEQQKQTVDKALADEKFRASDKAKQQLADTAPIEAVLAADLSWTGDMAAALRANAEKVREHMQSLQ